MIRIGEFRRAASAIVVIALLSACVGCSERSQSGSGNVSSANPYGRPTGKGEFPQELAAYRDAVEQSKLSYVAVHSRQESASIWASKFRGRAYWPKGATFPRDPHGEPLIMVAQINFAEMPPLEDYPNVGILQFFISGEVSREQVWGVLAYDEKPFDPQRWFASMLEQRYFRALYHADPTTDVSRLESPPQPSYKYVLPIMAEAALRFEKKSEYVLIDDYRFEKIFGKNAYDLFASFGSKEREVANRYIDFAHEWVPAKIGGYASFVQRDPRIAASEDDWLLLLEIQSAGPPESVEVMWGDAGVGGFFIRREDLIKRDFSRVAYYWDNH